MRRWFLAAALVWLSAVSVAAQQATLIADAIEVSPDGRLIARGNIVVFFEGNRLTATEVIYDRGTDRLTLTGPIVLQDERGALLLADAAEIEADFSAAILDSARLVLADQLQLAAGRIERREGRYTQLQRVIASSCEVCAANPVPAWEVRASRVIHDQDARQLYFNDAQFRIYGVPVFYSPRLRLPDPTLDRASGFLLPGLRTTNQLGTGITLPYFVRIGDRADVTLTPYLGPGTTTLEYLYRHAFSTGEIAFEGAVSRDDIEPGATRAFTFGRGAFVLPRDFRLSFNVEAVSDRAYLLEYDYSDKDRLENFLSLERTRRTDRFGARITRFRTLRESEEDLKRELPDRQAEIGYIRRLPTGRLGGRAWATFDARQINRPSEEDVFGRDVTRAGAALDWWRDWRLARGALLEADARIAFDSYAVRNDVTFSPETTRTIPAAALTLRWPLSRAEASGGTALLEPVAQLAWAEIYGGEVPNEDSITVEFDEGNLFALSRFPGSDVYETGLRANLGLSWSRVYAGGNRLGAVVGRVIRFGGTDQFGPGTGLDGDLSDWLGVLRYQVGDRLFLSNRALIDDGFSFTSAESRIDWRRDRSSVAATYLWSVARPQENRPDRLSELSFETTFPLTPNWRATAGLRYDFVNQRAGRALAGLTYENECFAVDLSVTRRYTSSAAIDPTTSFRVDFRLAGIGDGGGSTKGVRRTCSG